MAWSLPSEYAVPYRKPDPLRPARAGARPPGPATAQQWALRVVEKARRRAVRFVVIDKPDGVHAHYDGSKAFAFYEQSQRSKHLIGLYGHERITVEDLVSDVDGLFLERG